MAKRGDGFRRFPMMITVSGRPGRAVAWFCGKARESSAVE